MKYQYVERQEQKHNTARILLAGQPGDGRRLRVLILATRENAQPFHDILAVNIQRWGYEAVLLPTLYEGESGWREEVEGDILLYDMDASLQHVVVLESMDSEDVPSIDLKQIACEHIWPRVRLVIALSSHSISRPSLERMGAIAMLQKPFDMRHLERYLRVFQRLIYAEAGTPAESLIRPSEQWNDEEEDASATSIRRILVADDRQEITWTINQCLIEQEHRRYHYEVKEVHDGLELLEQYVTWRPHCIVTDILMPWLNGYQVMRCLADCAVQPAPAFVVMSALMQREILTDRQYFHDAKVSYIGKPFDVDHLLGVIEQVLA